MLDEYDPVLTIDDICVILSVGKNTAYSLLSTGAIKAFKIGRIWKIPKAAVVQYISTFGGEG